MLYTAFDPIYIHPLADGHRFPMIKYELIPEQLLHQGIIAKSDLVSPDRALDDSIVLTHTQEYWQRLRDLKLTAAEIRRIGFPLSELLVEREIRIAQGTINGALNARENKISFNIAGGTHHAGSDWGEGFCLLNDQAIAANYLLHRKLAERILIIDLDVHQGNGTAEIFNDNTSVFTFSMHAENNFPFRKEKSDLDVGLPDGINGEDYLDLLSNYLEQVMIAHSPDFIFYLSGVDVLKTDKLGKLQLTIQDCMDRDYLVLSRCVKSRIPVQVSMGGGYSPNVKDIVDAHCNTFKVARELFC